MRESGNIIDLTWNPDITLPILGKSITVAYPGRASITGSIEEVSYSIDEEGYVICNMRVKPN